MQLWNTQLIISCASLYDHIEAHACSILCYVTDYITAVPQRRILRHMEMESHRTQYRVILQTQSAIHVPCTLYSWSLICTDHSVLIFVVLLFLHLPALGEAVVPWLVYLSLERLSTGAHLCAGGHPPYQFLYGADLAHRSIYSLALTLDNAK